eukprot:4464136-Amphidinium_carterae.1
MDLFSLTLTRPRMRTFMLGCMDFALLCVVLHGRAVPDEGVQTWMSASEFRKMRMGNVPRVTCQSNTMMQSRLLSLGTLTASTFSRRGSKV